jgi:hypothetical protein
MPVGGHAVRFNRIARSPRGELGFGFVNSWTRMYGQGGRAVLPAKSYLTQGWDAFAIESLTIDPQTPPGPVAA